MCATSEPMINRNLSCRIESMTDDDDYCGLPAKVEKASIMTLIRSQVLTSQNGAVNRSTPLVCLKTWTVEQNRLLVRRFF